MPDENKRREQRNIEHAIHGFPSIEIVSSHGDHPVKGVTIIDKNGVKDQSEDLERGVEIHDPRNG